MHVCAWTCACVFVDRMAVQSRMPMKSHKKTNNYACLLYTSDAAATAEV